MALPSIQDDLGFSQSSLAWVVNAYLIAFGGLLLLAGRLGDLVGSNPRAMRQGKRRRRAVPCPPSRPSTRQPDIRESDHNADTHPRFRGVR